ncbi:hypothetical protein Y032_0206g1992 [Ancylostoma ceylanicum]|uniref:Uncharacterized protein n=1 Tax=Ancylostoma ceylanicum TaxID=53326 RepID=A0A016SM72_9BILA|nr:hypothetical protein Y032_0206g1992 [Ancylostoma ceylanicum]
MDYFSQTKSGRQRKRSSRSAKISGITQPLGPTRDFCRQEKRPSTVTTRTPARYPHLHFFFSRCLSFSDNFTSPRPSFPCGLESLAFNTSRVMQENICNHVKIT